VLVFRPFRVAQAVFEDESVDAQAILPFGDLRPFLFHRQMPVAATGADHHCGAGGFIRIGQVDSPLDVWAGRKPTTKGILPPSSRAANFACFVQPFVHSDAGFQFCGKSSWSWLAL